MSLRLEHWLKYPKIDAHCHAGGENPGDRFGPVIEGKTNSIELGVDL